MEENIKKLDKIVNKQLELLKVIREYIFLDPYYSKGTIHERTDGGTMTVPYFSTDSNLLLKTYRKGIFSFDDNIKRLADLRDALLFPLQEEPRQLDYKFTIWKLYELRNIPYLSNRLLEEFFEAFQYMDDQGPKFKELLECYRQGKKNNVKMYDLMLELFDYSFTKLYKQRRTEEGRPSSMNFEDLKE